MSAASGGRELLLLADDEPLSREFLQEALSQCGFEVHAVEDGGAAIAALEERDYDYVFTDLCMPGRDGREVLLASKQRDSERPVVLVTAHGTMSVAIDGPVADVWEQGKELYYARTGQLELSCANCHEDNYGNMIRADHLSQGQINGFPTYRLKNAKLNSVHARFKGCMKNIRATPYAEGGDEFKALELYIASRGQGLSVETPSVRN